MGAGGVAQVVEHLPSKRKAWNSNPSTTKKKKRIGVSHPSFLPFISLLLTWVLFCAAFVSKLVQGSILK
jgi:hypothetical protein